MNSYPTQNIKDMLKDSNIDFRERGNELITHCIFNDCDADSRGNEAHLYINANTGQYYCHKCGENGGMNGLNKAFGITPETLTRQTFDQPSSPTKLATKYHNQLPLNIREWLKNDRLLLEEDIDDYELGYGEFYGKSWVTIPVRDASGTVQFMKLRQDPFVASGSAKYMSTGGEGAIFNAEILKEKPDQLVICEGEFDCLVLRAFGIPAISSTAGARTFKQEWIDQLTSVRHLYICFDNDEAGEQGANELIEKLSQALPSTSVLQISLPHEVGAHGDITDYFKLPNADPSDLFDKYAELRSGPKPIDVSTFKEITTSELASVLDLTIKHDNENKLVSFLCMLSAYTEDSQLNVSFNAPSSTGKTYIPTQVAQYFPDADVRQFGGASPTAFFHDNASFDKDRNCYIVDLERKILVFLEQPNPKLQENLRPVMSHDKKEISYKITDKNQKGSNRAKNIIIRGFPATIFCSAGMRLDEQEATRAILLSPETTIEKVQEGVHMATLRNANKAEFLAKIEASPERQQLKDRVLAIKQEHVDDIVVPDPNIIERRFLSHVQSTKPRHQRDVSHLLSIIKCITLLNVWYRRADNGNVVATQSDIDQGFEVWQKINKSQELNIPPYTYEFYKKYIVPIYVAKNADREPNSKQIGDDAGVSRKEIIHRHYELENRLPNDDILRRQILPMLEAAGLITQEKDPYDKRNKLIFPQLIEPEQYSGEHGGVTNLEQPKA
ncbi:MAG: toprim domain-containing protein [Candidatus Saccharibacteria bacterium]|nr:toprim domain-containing protein [Candidatus Saccharibacteria bacterium]